MTGQQEPSFEASLRVVGRTTGHFIWAVVAALILIGCWVGVTGWLVRTGSIWAYALLAIESILFVLALFGLRALARNPRYW